MSPSNAAAPAPPPSPPPLCREPAGPFDMWRDYLGLAALVAALPPEPPRDAPPAAPPGPPCGFCRHNGEAPSVYRGHSLRDAGGRLQCPVLRSYVCPQCGATQDRAHTRRFCPLTRRGYTSVYVRPRTGDATGKRAAKGGKK